MENGLWMLIVGGCCSLGTAKMGLCPHRVPVMQGMEVDLSAKLTRGHRCSKNNGMEKREQTEKITLTLKCLLCACWGVGGVRGDKGLDVSLQGM